MLSDATRSASAARQHWFTSRPASRLAMSLAIE